VLVLAQVRGNDTLNNFAKVLNDAKSLSATYTVQPIGGTQNAYKVDLAKPNKARIDTPSQLIVADGTTITTYDKGDQSYYKKPETESDLKALFATDDMSLLGAFFDAGFYGKIAAAKAAGQKSLKGVSYDVVEATINGSKMMAFYVDPADKLAKAGRIDVTDKSLGKTDTTLIVSKELTVNGNQAATLFAFTAPSGAREISMDELNAGKWYTDLNEAQSIAKKLNKPLFVDFYADW